MNDKDYTKSFYYKKDYLTDEQAIAIKEILEDRNLKIENDKFLEKNSKELRSPFCDLESNNDYLVRKSPLLNKIYEFLDCDIPGHGYHRADDYECRKYITYENILKIITQAVDSILSERKEHIEKLQQKKLEKISCIAAMSSNLISILRKEENFKDFELKELIKISNDYAILQYEDLEKQIKESVERSFKSNLSKD